MTIGIAAVGKNAGLAVWKALNSVEKVSKGSIGGFATFVIFDEEGKLEYFCTQRGGSRTLFIEGDSISTYPPKEVIEARIAGVVSSGPDRTEPLENILPAKNGVGFVTGHRFPRAIGKDGFPVNEQVLDNMEKGESALIAVKKVMDKNPNIDSGLIAVDLDGNIGAQNSQKVEKRPGFASASIEREGAKVVVFNNEIYPSTVTANLAAEIAMEIMCKDQQEKIKIILNSGLKVELASEDKVIINEDNIITKIFITDETMLKGKTGGMVPYLGSQVIRNGKKIGELKTEPFINLDNGVIKEFKGNTKSRDLWAWVD